MTAVERAPGGDLVALLIASAGPVSLDRLVALELARPMELWRWLEEARAKGLVAEDSEAGPGSFLFRDQARRQEVLAAARREDWAALVRREGVAEAMVAAARADLVARRFGPAAATLGAVLRCTGREAFPGGDRAWLQAVEERVRFSAFNEGVEPAEVDVALDLAVEHGDLRAQAVLAALRGLTARRLEGEAQATAWFERAAEAAEALGDGGVSLEVHVRIAYSHLLSGRPHAAIATFERLLGDLGEELVPTPPRFTLPFAAHPEGPLAVLCATYGQIGQYGRGFDLLHRLREAGTRLARPELVALGDAALAGLHAERRELDRLRAHAEPAFAHWCAAGTEPWLVWHLAQALALARVSEGQLAEAAELLGVGQRARAASGMPYFSGSALFEALDGLEAAGGPAPPGLALSTEIDEMLRWPGPCAPAIAMRYQARRLARAPDAEARTEEIDALLQRSVELLRTSRSYPIELARSLEEAGLWAARRRRPEEADRLAAEAREVFASLDLTPRTGSATPRLTAALVELGRIGALGAPGEGRESVWGGVATRLCAALGAERCALVEAAAEEPRPLAVRGGGQGWLAGLLALARTRHPEAVELMTPSAAGAEAAALPGQLLVLPFEAPALDRRGWAFLQYRYSRPAIAAEDHDLLAFAGAQLGVVLENVGLWQELSAARARLEQENRYYRESAPSTSPRGRIVGDSPALRRVLSLVERVAPASTTVLVTGETGVGKELVAREVHRLSPRGEKPFIAVHIASLAPGLVASGLFGHERGAFTGATDLSRGRFELADGGTLFLDEIGELGLEDQVRLLRVLQEGTFERVGGTRPIRSDFRLVAATNRDLAAEVKAGRFREDLFFRLSVFPIHVPPLRERREEIPTLALYFMEGCQRRRGVRFEGIGEADIARLVAHPWPGNVRELEHVIERAVLLSDPPRLRIPPLERDVGRAAEGEAEGLLPLEEVERRHVRRVVEHARGRITGAGGIAEILGLSPSTASWRIARLGLKPDLERARRR